MYKITLSVLFALLSVGLSAHDLQISIFDVKPDAEGNISLFVRLDKQDILGEMYAYCDDLKQENQCFENYINEHFSISMDGMQIDFSIAKINHTAQFIEIDLVSTTKAFHVKNIQVFNDVLITSMPEQENIVRFSLNDQLRSFRMNGDRTKTSITY